MGFRVLNFIDWWVRLYMFIPCLIAGGYTVFTMTDKATLNVLWYWFQLHWNCVFVSKWKWKETNLQWCSLNKCRFIHSLGLMIEIEPDIYNRIHLLFYLGLDLIDEFIFSFNVTINRRMLQASTVFSKEGHANPRSSMKTCIFSESWWDRLFTTSFSWFCIHLKNMQTPAVSLIFFFCFNRFRSSGSRQYIRFYAFPYGCRKKNFSSFLIQSRKWVCDRSVLFCLFVLNLAH